MDRDETKFVAVAAAAFALVEGRKERREAPTPGFFNEGFSEVNLTILVGCLERMA